jgi:hypothetical protein
MQPTVFSQRDPRWADVRLGHSYTTLGGYGCLVCAVASALVDFGLDTDPARLNRWLARNGGFTGGNLFVFGAVEGLGMALERLVDCARRPAPVGELAEALEDGAAVVAKVDFHPGGGVNEHWVRVLRFTADDALIVDPWLPPGAGLTWLMPRYAPPGWEGPARAIFRAAVYVATGTSSPAPRSVTTEHQGRVCRR